MEQTVTLRANIGAYFLTTPVLDAETMSIMADSLRQVLASHPAVSDLDTGGMTVKSAVFLGVRNLQRFGADPSQVVEAMGALRHCIYFDSPVRFVLDASQLSEEEGSPFVIDVRWDGAVFLAFWDTSVSPNYWTGGILVRELLQEVIKKAHVEAFIQPPTIASTDLLVVTGDPPDPQTISVDDPERSRATASLVVRAGLTADQACDASFAILRDLMHAFYLLENVHSAREHVERSANMVATTVLAAEYDRARVDRRHVVRQAQMLLRIGRMRRESHLILYLFAAEYQRLGPVIRQRLADYENEAGKLGGEMFRRDANRVVKALERSDQDTWIRTADHLEERQSTHYIGLATIASAVSGGIVGAILTRVFS
jgi:hypothetical protein